MLVRPTTDKAKSIKQIITDTLELDFIPIRQFAQLVGKLAATLPGNRYGLLFLKNFEYAKAKALKNHLGNYEANMNITDPIKQDLTWWLHNIDLVSKPVYIPNPQITLYTDASFQG
jgi:hypothetical protein